MSVIHNEAVHTRARLSLSRPARLPFCARAEATCVKGSYLRAALEKEKREKNEKKKKVTHVMMRV